MWAAILGFILKMASGGILEKALDAFAPSKETISGHQIDADVVKDAMRQYVESQKVEATKWSFPWFPLMAAPFIASIGLFFITLTAYNVLWHSKGIWPQPWTIAAYPGVYQEWATQAFNWVFAPALGAVTIKTIFGRK